MKIKKIKLNALSSEAIQQKEMNAIVGGKKCGCSCAYETHGGSTTSANMSANYRLEISSLYGCNQVTLDDQYGMGVLIQNHA